MAKGSTTRTRARRRTSAGRRTTANRTTGAPSGRILILLLLVALLACVPVLLVKVANAPYVGVADLAPPMGLLAALVGVIAFLRLAGFRGDATLLMLTLLLTTLGVAMQYRIGTFKHSALAVTSGIAYATGLVLMLAAAVTLRGGRHRLLRGTWFLAYLAAVAVLAVVTVLGRRFRGALFLPGNVNPTEIVKPLLVVFLAGFLEGHREALARRPAFVPPLGVVVTLGILWAIPMALLLIQRDLGLIVLLNGVLVVMLAMVSGRSGYLVAGAGAMVALGVAVFIFVPHGQSRFEVWQDPFQSPTGAGWQALQALAAMYSGGLWGTGIGIGFPHAVPIVSADFIYAAMAEEMGYIGCALVLLAYGLLYHRAAGVASAAKPAYSSLMAMGLTAVLAVQTVLNLAGVTKALPLTGITLPFISHGGSSLVTTFVIMGILLAVSDPGPGQASRKRKR